MTEAEWLACDNALRMLRFSKGRMTDRKLRLFACACCHAGPADDDADLHAAVAAIELYADGLIGEKQLADYDVHTPNILIRTVTASEAADAAYRTAAALSYLPLCRLLHDLIGNPFRPAAVDPRWLTSTARDLARTIYEDRAFDRLPILADALEEAGCDNADVLTHLRGDGPHVRGCWALDLVLGKE